MKTIKLTRRGILIAAVTLIMSVGIALAAEKTCSPCKGSGTSNNKCSPCKGTGFSNGGKGDQKCNSCDGKRFTKCAFCFGKGKTN